MMFLVAIRGTAQILPLLRKSGNSKDLKCVVIRGLWSVVRGLCTTSQKRSVRHLRVHSLLN